MSIKIDANSRTNPLFNDLTVFDRKLAQRIVDIAIPFLNLYGPIGLLTNTVLGTAKSWQHLSLLPSKFRSSQWLEFSKNCGFLAFTVTSVALSYLAPQIGLLMNQAMHLLTEAYSLLMHLSNAELMNAGYDLLHIIYALIYVTSIIYATPELVIISILSQMIQEGGQAIFEFKEGRILEGIAKLVMISIRGYQAAPQAINLHRNYFGKSITQTEFVKLLNEASSTSVAVEDLFKKNYFSSHVKNLKLPPMALLNLLVENLTIENCNFENIISINTIFNNCVINNSQLNGTFYDSSFTNCTFNACHLKNIYSVNTKFNNVNFLNSVFQQFKGFSSSFKNSNFINSHIAYSDFIGSSFTNISITNSSFLRTDFTQCFFMSSSISKATFSMCELNSLMNECLFEKVSFDGCRMQGLMIESSTIRQFTIKESNCNGMVLTHSTLKNGHWHNSLMDKIYFYKNKISSVEFSNNSMNRASIKKTAFDHSSFNESILSRSTFAECDLNHTIFKNSNLKNACIYNSKTKKLRFDHCDLVRTCFNDSTLKEVEFKNSTMHQTNFLGATVFRGKLTECDLTNCLLLDTKESFEITGGVAHHLNKPIIALAWNLSENQHFASMIDSIIDDQNAIALLFDYNPVGIDKESLNFEVLKPQKNDKSLSIAQSLILNASETSEIAKLKHKAASVMKHAQALILPGGEDIEAELYGEVSEKKNSYLDTSRSLFEFALIAEAQKSQTPTMGICRGAQIVNVYFGGTLEHHVEGHHGEIHDLKLKQGLSDELKRMVEPLIGEGIKGVSMHHQACKQIGKNLHVVVEHEGSPELLISEDGNFLLSQFHPESYKDTLSYPELKKEKCEIFFKRLINRAKEKIKL